MNVSLMFIFSGNFQFETGLFIETLLENTGDSLPSPTPPPHPPQCVEFSGLLAHIPQRQGGQNRLAFHQV